MVTSHASENCKKYLNPTYTNKAAAVRFVAAVNVALGNTGSTAIVLELGKAAKNPFRDDWKISNELVAIIRHGKMITAMLSRTEQINKSHLRTDRIIRA